MCSEAMISWHSKVLLSNFLDSVIVRIRECKFSNLNPASHRTRATTPTLPAPTSPSTSGASTTWSRAGRLGSVRTTSRFRKVRLLSPRSARIPSLSMRTSCEDRPTFKHLVSQSRVCQSLRNSILNLQIVTHIFLFQYSHSGFDQS